MDNDGKLGVLASSRKVKKILPTWKRPVEGILALSPVTFHYKPELDKTGTPQFGLIAEEVAKVNPDLVTHDDEGMSLPYATRR